MMNLAASKTRTQFPLSFKKVWKKTTGSLIASIILIPVIIGIAWILGFSLDIHSGWIWIISTGLIIFVLISLLLTFLYQRWYFAVYFYELTDDFIIIRKGPITPHEITVPYERIQDVYVDQDILDRIYGIYDVHISSATLTSGWFAHIDGVEKPAADGLRQAILSTVSKKIGRNITPPQPPANEPANH